MAQEFATKTFFNLEPLGLSYYSAQIALEKYIATRVLRGDLSRILFTSTSFSFRARFEQTDRSVHYTGASSLNFPFASYWYDGYWSDDDRPAVQNTHLMTVGIGDGTRKIRARAVKTSIDYTFYFDTDSEARIAYDNIQWMVKPRSAIIETGVKYKNSVIGIPIILELESLTFNPEFTEKEWLTQNRILPLTAKFTLRTYVLGPNIQVPVTNGLTGGFRDDIAEAYTEHVKFFFSSFKGIPAADINEDADLSTVLDAYFNPTYEIVVDSLIIRDVSFHNAFLDWIVSYPNALGTDTLTNVTIKIPGIAPISVDNPPLSWFLEIPGLRELSTYTAHVYFTSPSGKVKIQTITFSTTNDPSTADNEGLAGLKSLKGVTF